MQLFFGKRITPGVPAIIKNSKGEILLEKRAKNVLLYPGYWGLPGGLIEYGETIEQAIRREIREELGVDSKVIKYAKKPMMNFAEKGKKLQYLDIPVYCKIKGKPMAKDETQDVKWFAPKEIKKMKMAYNHKEILKQEGII